MLTTKDTPLVANAARFVGKREAMKIQAVRGFMYRGEAVPVGETLDLPVEIAQELIATAKAVRVTSGPEETEQEPQKRRGRPPKTKEQEQ